MIGLDTNLLVYAHREDSAHHERAAEVLHDVVRRGVQVGIPWPCLHEFLAVVTHPRLYAPPTAVPVALDAVRSLLGVPTVHVLAEGADHLAVLARLLGSGEVRGARVHDARVAAICLAAGVSELWSADRDFGWFPELTVVNPLVQKPAG